MLYPALEELSQRSHLGKANDVGVPIDKPLDTEVLWGSCLAGLWDSRKLSSNRWRGFSMGKVALLLSDIPYWHIMLRKREGGNGLTWKNVSRLYNITINN